MVSLTSLRGAKDQTVILFAREHPFLQHDTCVLYSNAELMDADRLATLIVQGDAKWRDPVSPAVLRLILDGFMASDYTKSRIEEYVRAYRTALRSGGG